MRPHHRPLSAYLGLLLIAVAAGPVVASSAPQSLRTIGGADADRDGLPDSSDTCPIVTYVPGFDGGDCGPMDLNPGNDVAPECKARERVAQLLVSAPAPHIAFSIVVGAQVHFADAFAYLGAGQFAHDPDGIHRLYRVGSTSKSFVATAAKILEEAGGLSLGDFVSDDDGSQVPAGGERTLRNLLTHQGAFKLDSGALHLFCYPGDLAAFWAEPDDLVSPHYDSATYGNLGGGFAYSAFNYSLAGAYLANRAAEGVAQILQARIFDPTGMCTATLDGPRAASTPIGGHAGLSTSSSMHVGPYINLVSQTDTRCEDNFYSSEDLPGDPYSYQYYRLDEAGAEARDPPGGVIASVIDMAHFAAALLASYRGPGGLLSEAGIRELWGAVSDLECSPNCPYEPYYGIGFFTDSQAGGPVSEVGHGGSRAGYTSAFVLRPEANLAVSILTDADVNTVVLSDLAKTILDEFEPAVGVASNGGPATGISNLAWVAPNPLAATETATIHFSIPRASRVQIRGFDVRGRLVRTFVDKAYSPGSHSVRWKPGDDGLGPGVYFVPSDCFGHGSYQEGRRIAVGRRDP